MTWKILDWINPRYEVNEVGDVRSTNRLGNTIIMSPKRKQDGYLTLGLSVKSKQTFFMVHRLVAQAFIPNPDNKAEVDHLNKKRDDNRVENLEWVSRKENYARSDAGFDRGEKHPNCKISDAEIAEIIRLDCEGILTRTQIAHQFGISESHIGVLRRGARTSPLIPDENKNWRRVKVKRPVYRYPDSLVAEIAFLLSQGKSRNEVSILTGAPYGLVAKVHAGKRSLSHEETKT